MRSVMADEDNQRKAIDQQLKFDPVANPVDIAKAMKHQKAMCIAKSTNNSKSSLFRTDEFCECCARPLVL